jgi:hypothetical protein
MREDGKQHLLEIRQILRVSDVGEEEYRDREIAYGLVRTE